MIATLAASETAVLTVVLRPNASLDWFGAKLFFAVTAIFAGLIGLVCALNGLWLVLPWTGLELLALGAALVFCQRQNERQEIITVGADRVVIEGGRRQPEWRHEFNRVWAQLDLQSAAIRGHPNRLTIRSHGRTLELGRFLTNEERKELRRLLADVMGATGR